MITAAIIIIVISAGLIFGAMFYLLRDMRASVGSQRERIVTDIRAAEERLNQLLGQTEHYASRGQYETLGKMLEQLQAELEQEKKSLKDIETKLDRSQEDVEKKEGQQQAMKTAREEDEEALEGIMSSYSTIRSDAINLERRLAESLKELDRMRAELDLTPDQRDVLDELTKAMTSAGGLLRDLITEHSALYERLEQLRQQHRDLEDEYTKLVEQQLGE